MIRRRRRDAMYRQEKIGGAFAGKEVHTRVGSRRWKRADSGRAISTQNDEQLTRWTAALSDVPGVTRYEITLEETSEQDKRDRKVWEGGGKRQRTA